MLDGVLLDIASIAKRMKYWSLSALRLPLGLEEVQNVVEEEFEAGPPPCQGGLWLWMGLM